MCGIAGLFVARGGAAERCDLDAMIRAIRHRGPDGTDRWARDDGLYEAGFARLAIIDLETGGQPLVEADGPYVLSGNGEIYNYLELRADHAGYSYRTRGDMETVLATAHALGDDFPAALNGMYALALYDRARHRLTLVRDRFGVKPLYWARTPAGGVVYASEIKALFASGLVARAVDENAVTQYLTHGYVPGPGTLYRGVYKLQPGRTLVFESDGDAHETTYWRPRPGEGPAAPEAAAETMEALLDDSVRLQLRSDVPVGLLLSGGLDSGLLCALAQRHGDRPVDAFTVRFEGAPYDETPLARAIAEHTGARHTVIDLAADGAAAHFPRLIWHMEEPLADAAFLPNFLVERALAKHVKVALNGTGGDELFAGYGRYFMLPVERRFMALPKPLRTLVRAAVGAVSPMTAWKLGRAERFEAASGQYLNDHTTFFPPPMLDLIGHPRPLPGAAQQEVLAGVPTSLPVQTRALIADIGTYLCEDLLTLLDRTSMAVGVEGRVPFLDHRLAEAALALPPEVRTPEGRQKGLERRIAEKFLPAAVIDAPKQGFASPVPAWMRGTLGREAAGILTSERALARGWWTEQL